MTKSARYQQAREAIAKWLAGITTTDEDASAVLWAFEDQEYYRQKADGLLSLSDPNGKPYLAVVSADEAYPITPYTVFSQFPGMNEQLNECQRKTLVELLAAGFVKVEKP